MLQTGLYYFIQTPRKDSPEFVKHKKYCFITVILLYLIYSLIQIELSLPLSYYQLLDSTPFTDDKNIKSAFRRLSLTLHPVFRTNEDKMQNYDQHAQEMFVKIRDAYDVLKDPVKRAAYGTTP